MHTLTRVEGVDMVELNNLQPNPYIVNINVLNITLEPAKKLNKIKSLYH